MNFQADNFICHLAFYKHIRRDFENRVKCLSVSTVGTHSLPTHTHTHTHTHTYARTRTHTYIRCKARTPLGPRRTHSVYLNRDPCLSYRDPCVFPSLCNKHYLRDDTQVHPSTLVCTSEHTQCDYLPGSEVHPSTELY